MQLSFIEVNIVCLLHNIDQNGVCAPVDIVAIVNFALTEFFLTLNPEIHSNTGQVANMVRIGKCEAKFKQKELLGNKICLGRVLGIVF